jgi:predicted GNAT family N-acyltransferase
MVSGSGRGMGIGKMLMVSAIEETERLCSDALG